MNQPAFLHRSVGDYQLVDFLGAGGMGEVYRAVHSKIGRVVAVKILTPSAQGAASLDRFLNEARVHSRLQHQNIATLFDFLEMNGNPCIVMEYADGETLAEAIASRGALPCQEALFIFQEILKAVCYIHENGIVHRDIKSSNIKITSRGEIKLLDFGIAKGEFTPQLTTVGSVIGTLQYLAPELISGAPADARTDVWALGVLLYEMVAGKMPFEGASIAELFTKIQNADYTAPSLWLASAPKTLDRIVSRCLKKRPEDRYGSARQLLEDVQALIESLSGSQSPEYLLKDRRRWNEKIPWKWVMPSAAVFAILVLAVLSFREPESPVTGEATTATSRSKDAQPASSSRQKDERSTLRPVLIDVAEGQAAVYENSRQIGTTPYEFQARPGDRVDLVLKAEGFNDLRVTFDVGENRNKYVYPLEKVQAVR